MTENKYAGSDLHQETARVYWPELETHFARGVVIRVVSELNLVEVATCFANDDKAAVDRWIGAGQIKHLSTHRAIDWSGRDPELWSVVVSPWVLVQERTV